MNKKNKFFSSPRILLFMIIATIFSLFSTTCLTVNIVSAKGSDGNETTALQKLYAYTLYSCISYDNTNIWNTGLIYWGEIQSEAAASGDWFNNNADIGILLNIVPGAYIENAVQGDYGDGKINCGQNNNALVSKGLSALNLSIQDVACNYKDNYATGGVFSTDAEAYTCSDGLSRGDEYFGISDNRADYFEDIVKQKTFGGQLPGGKWEPTVLEEYYLKRNTFMTACASDGPHFNNKNLAYQITLWNSDTGKWESAGYSQSNLIKPDKKFNTYLGNSQTCQELANNLKEGKYFKAYQKEQEALMAQDPNHNPNPSSQDGGDGQEDTKDCYDSGIDSMAWILCPISENTKSTVDGLDKILRGWLQVDPNQIFNSGIETGWEVFRNIGNAALIIIFLVIIFSQLTGVGIDNYGIKKMLPKLIVMAVLINLSYFLCQLAVDLSNILGVGLDNLFKSIGEGMDQKNSTLSIAGIFTGVMAIIGGSGAVAGIAVASGGGIMIVVSLALALIVALVSVLMFFVTLGARMVIIIVFTIISPVAFALYILPNTQSLFKKWWKVFQSALIVFPICGALYGASYIIKAAVLAGQNATNEIELMPGVIAIIAPVLPFLLIPSLLKGALAGLGMLGGALTTLGNGLKKGTASGKSAIENTKAYKGAQERAADRSAERRARRVRDRLQRASQRGNLSDSQRRRLYQAQTLLNERAQQRAQDRAGVFDLYNPERADIVQSRADAARDAQEYKAFQDQFANPDFDLGNEVNRVHEWYNPEDHASQQRMRALVGAMETRGMESQIYNMLRNNNVSNDSATMNALANSSNKVLKAYGKKGTGVDFSNFMNGTGEQSMQGYIESKGDEFLDGLDDKALREIATHGNGSTMSTELLTHAASKIKNAESLEQINNMLRNRNDVAITGADLAGLNVDTFNAIHPEGSFRNIDTIIAASNDIANNTDLLNKLNPATRDAINRLRSTRGESQI